MTHVLPRGCYWLLPSMGTAHKKHQPWKASSLLATTQEDRECCWQHQQTTLRPSGQRPPEPPQLCTLGRWGMGKNRIRATERQGSHQSSGFSEPRLLHLHIHRQVLNSFVWDASFSLINSHRLMLPLPGFRCQNKPGVYSWLLPPLFGAIPRGTWGAVPGA